MATGNYKAWATAIKAELEARGQTWTTNCDSFEITGRLAWQLRGFGAVLMPKNPAQNGCTLTRGPSAGQRVSHDAIGFPDGHVDCLVGAGPPQNTNAPAWQWHPGPPVLGLQPFDLDAGTVEPKPDGKPDRYPDNAPWPPPPLPTAWADEGVEPYSYPWYGSMSGRVEVIYLNLLWRWTDFQGAANWLHNIREDGMQPDAMIAAIKESPEYKALHR